MSQDILGEQERQEKAAGVWALKFVVVANDGSALELDPNEIEYLNTEFDPRDGDRPYIKSSYAELTPDGRMHGYLLRSALPPDVRVTSPETEPVLTPEAAIEASRQTFQDIVGPTDSFAAVLERGIWQVTAVNPFGAKFVVKISQTGRVAFGGMVGERDR